MCVYMCVQSSTSSFYLNKFFFQLSGRKPRGEGKKCRKVYGMENRDMWCTACRWKKACQRFIDWSPEKNTELCIIGFSCCNCAVWLFPPHRALTSIEDWHSKANTFISRGRNSQKPICSNIGKTNKIFTKFWIRSSYMHLSLKEQEQNLFLIPWTTRLSGHLSFILHHDEYFTFGIT